MGKQDFGPKTGGWASMMWLCGHIRVLTHRHTKRNSTVFGRSLQCISSPSASKRPPRPDNEVTMSLPEPEQRGREREGERERDVRREGRGRDTLTSYNLNCLIHNALCGPIYMVLVPLGERTSSITLLY